MSDANSDAEGSGPTPLPQAPFSSGTRKVLWGGAVALTSLALVAVVVWTVEHANPSTTSVPAAVSPGPTTPPPRGTVTTGRPEGSGRSTRATGHQSGAAAAVRSVADPIEESAHATFSASYELTGGHLESVTFAQSPPKQAIITSGGSFYIDGTTITECHSAAAGSCTVLPASFSSTLDEVTQLFAPGLLTTTFQRLEAQVTAHTAGVKVSTSKGTYGGLASTCLIFTGPAEPASVEYCAADSAGILTYFRAGTTTGVLSSYSLDPPASTFSPPVGSTVQTLPSSSGVG